MIEFWNVVIAWIAGIITGLAIHSAYLHSKRLGELPPQPWNHEETERERGGESPLKIVKLFLMRRRRKATFISALLHETKIRIFRIDR